MAGDITDIFDRYPRFLQRLASHRVFDALARLNEPCQRRKHPGRKVRLTSQQDPPLMFHDHDHDRVNAWEMVGGTGSAMA